jgi:hypothetical protein
VAVRTNDGRESRARPQRFRGHCVIALRAGHRLTPPEGRMAGSSAQQGFAAWQTGANLPQLVFLGSSGSHPPSRCILSAVLGNNLRGYFGLQAARTPSSFWTTASTRFQRLPLTDI